MSTKTKTKPALAGLKKTAKKARIPGRAHYHAVRGTTVVVTRAVFEPSRKKVWITANDAIVPDRDVEVRWK